MKGAVTNRRAAPSLNYNMKDINFLLKTNLRPDCVPDESLNTSVLKRAKEIENMKRKAFRIRVAAAAVIGILAVGSTAFAAYHYLTPSQVAEELAVGNSLSKAFESADAVNINETQHTGGYIVSLLGMVSGKNLIPEISDDANAQDIEKDKTYAVVAIEKENHSPMPVVSDDAYQTFCLSPLIHGKTWMEANNGTLDAGVSSFVQDGIQYELLECDNLEPYGETGVYLGVVSKFGEEPDAFSYDSSTGSYGINPDYKGMNALFELPLDETK